MLNEIYSEAEERMKKTIEVLKKEFASIRAGRANPAILDKIRVDYYGVPTPINQMANISVPEPRLLMIQPWDKSVIGNIEKAILKSDLGLNPNNDGSVIRISIPQLTEERRKELVKMVKKKSEDFRVEVRNSRRDANDQIKMFEKDGEISEDDARKGIDKIQELTDNYIEKINQLLENKEMEIMEV
ncbi:ribosome recycling factor [Desulfitibacter alkalitolerans]|uniref:ribosome recycling factor n=1 Tax=Desulfitibacter alkalitolerans TaxID=264641 RepID=UPI000482901E|nr:ribosome recycling factor [Desulfitibacter alkalitolerans]